jgi:hypothetical protein
MRMNKGQLAQFTTLDSYIAGYLTLQGFQPDLVDQGGKVVFVFESSDGLNQAIAAYHTGAKVQASVLASAVKSLKGQIHAVRREKGKRYGSQTGQAG